MLLVTPHLSVTPHLREVSDDIDMWYRHFRHFDDHRDFDSANRTGMCTGMFAVSWIDMYRHVAGRLRPVSRQSPLPCHVIIVPPREGGCSGGDLAFQILRAAHVVHHEAHLIPECTYCGIFTFMKTSFGSIAHLRTRMDARGNLHPFDTWRIVILDVKIRLALSNRQC